MSARRTTLGTAENRLNSQPQQQSSQKASRLSLARHQKQPADQLMSAMKISDDLQNPRGRPSMIAQQVRDPRNLRDKQWQMAAIHNLIQYLCESGYERDLSPKILSSPSAKDFQMIFKFLYTRIDPLFLWNSKKFEEDVPLVLRSLKYPFADSITKSSLFAVGSVASWPQFLGTLVWLTELIILADTVVAEVQAGPVDSMALFFYQFVCRAYCHFVNNGDEGDWLRDDLNGWFAKRDSTTTLELSRAREEQLQLQEEISALEQESSELQDAQERNDLLRQDSVKVNEWSDKLSAKQQSLIDTIRRLKAEEQQKQNDLRQAIDQRDNLLRIVDSQELKPADVDLMNSDREQYSKQIVTLSNKIDKVTNKLWEAEINVQKKMDSIEVLMSSYSSFCYELQLLPLSAKNAVGIQYELTFNAQASNPSQMINCVDLKGTIRNGVEKLRVKLKNQVVKSRQELASTMDQIEKVLDAINQQKDIISVTDNRMKQLTQQHDIDCEVKSREIVEKTQEAEQLMKEMRKQKSDGARQLSEVKRALRMVELERDQLQKKHQELRDRLETEYSHIISELQQFKLHVAHDVQDLHNVLHLQYKEAEAVATEEQSIDNLVLDPRLQDGLSFSGK